MVKAKILKVGKGNKITEEEVEMEFPEPEPLPKGVSFEDLRKLIKHAKSRGWI